MNSINLFDVAQMGVIIMGGDLYVNRGCKIAGLALGILGYLGITLYKSAQKRYWVSPPLNFPLDEHEAEFKSAIAKINTYYPESLTVYKLQHNLTSDEELFAHFKEKLNEGICYGLLAALFKGRKKVFPEEAFFYQILQLVRFDLNHLLPKDSIQAIRSGDPICHFRSSVGFRAEEPSENYRSYFEAVFHDKDVIGVVHIPRHVIGVQSGRAGYYLYDSLSPNKGLFEYPDKETFFWGVREHVLADIKEIQAKFALLNPAEVFYQLHATSMKPMLT